MTASWSDFIGNRRIHDWFATAIRRQRFAGSFLLVGPTGVGKRTVANLLSRTILCETNPAADMNPCGTCEGCIKSQRERILMWFKLPSRMTNPRFPWIY